jgi:integrase/recombinase XerD
MPQRRSDPQDPKGRLPDLGEPSDPQNLTRLCRQFLDWSRVQGYSPETLRSRAGHLRFFLLWCEERGLGRAGQITRPMLERYQRSLHHHRQRSGEPLSLKSQTQRLLSLKVFFRWLARQNLLLYNPASELELPRSERRLPKHVLSAAEAERVLSQPDLSSLVGVRDRAILETFYSTGIRRQELQGLDLGDVDLERGLLMVRQGKGRRDRLLPLGQRAAAWLNKYLQDVRPRCASDPLERALFVTSEGLRMRGHELTKGMARYVEAAGIGKSGSCHIFRHTMATLMLENGADLRYIQEMLGHADLKATQLYTHLSIRKLQEVHAATHPAERPRKRGQSEAELEAEAAPSDASPLLEDAEEPAPLRLRARRGSRQHRGEDGSGS